MIRQAAKEAHAKAHRAQVMAKQAARAELTIKTTLGWVHGVREEIDDATSPEIPIIVRTWRGIPFGQSTSGSHRFQAPRPAAPWSGIRHCREFGPVAPQPTYSWQDKIIGSEDCLSLDIVRPDTDEELPVVVYFHGGSFIVGSSHMQMLRGYRLAVAMNVVYVSVNFRLGALGYLDLRSLPGDCVANPAVMDQILALQWVRDNIEFFGGKPQTVTAMGESAGGAAVLTLMTSPAAEGLFHRAIAQSPPITMIHSRAQSTLWARELVRRLALPRGATIDELRAQDVADIVRAGQSMMWRGGELVHLNSTYAPTVDGDIIPRHPLEAFALGTQSKVPLLIGTNSDEASFSKFMFQRESARRRAALRLLASFDGNGAPAVLEAYGGGVERYEFAQLLADALFWAPTIRIAECHCERSKTWMYRFDFASKTLKRLGLGAMHSMELSNIFGDSSASRASLLLRTGDSSEMQALTVAMQRHWAHFIHYGSPEPDWPEYTTSPNARRKRETLIFDAPTYIVADPKAVKRCAWENYEMEEWGTGRPDILERIGFLLEGM
ncbi:MAG: carboxylesterase/lipase family protein [Corynebacterium sp.]|nr:carboxylesterase/lipase family protein [Corynebacterium sp.]